MGDQTGGRVFLFLKTDDFWRDCRDMKSRGVWFAEPREEGYGTVAVLLDPYGNRWNLVELRTLSKFCPTGTERCRGNDDRNVHIGRLNQSVGY